STQVYPRLQVLFGGKDAEREPQEIDVEEFIGVKSFKAKGKRLTTFEIKDIVELEPTRFPEVADEEPENTDEIEENDGNEKVDNEEVIDKKKIIEDITGQMSLF
ncbi:MAG: DNA gyrase/topoisomerase IV subunit A, partial [Paludibacter sp.]|nr:DNA gyrase/topoisomerase IV subunit A [Paludibacter sp.]